MIVFSALSATLVAVLASAGAAAVASDRRAAAFARRRARIRAAELAHLAAAAQRWRLTPPALGGPAGGGFGAVSFRALGLGTRLFHPRERRTASGVYRLVPVPSCPAVDAAAARAGLEDGGDALLVVGYDPISGEDAAVVVLSPLVQIALARVPWEWIAALSRAPEPATARLPARPDAVADRPEAPRTTTLRLVGWPPTPAPPMVVAPDPPPLHRLTAWRRAA